MFLVEQRDPVIGVAPTCLGACSKRYPRGFCQTVKQISFQFGSVGIAFKGSGFYKNDSRSGAKSKSSDSSSAEGSDKAPATSESDSTAASDKSSDTTAASNKSSDKPSKPESSTSTKD